MGANGGEEDKRTQALKKYLFTTLDGVEAYAQITSSERHWYKVFFFTPVGCLKCDTTYTCRVTKNYAKSIIKIQKLTKTSPIDVFVNWRQYMAANASDRKFEIMLAERWNA